MTSDTMDEATFLQMARAQIQAVCAACDSKDPDVVEAIVEADVVKISFGSGLPYVLNMQRPVREIWLAAERQAWHFRYDGTQWLDKRNGDELRATLQQRVHSRCGAQLWGEG
jgi:CyaY protein